MLGSGTETYSDIVKPKKRLTFSKHLVFDGFLSYVILSYTGQSLLLWFDHN